MPSSLRSRVYRVAGLREARPLSFDDVTTSAFEELIAAGGVIDYRLDPPKHEFLRYAAERRGLLLHGSTHGDIEQFTPREQTDFHQRLVTAVFATSDGIWPLFFAVVRRAKGGSIVNTCIQVAEPDGPRCFYYFSTSSDPAAPDSWTDGFVYLLSRDGFRKHPSGPEWTCPDPVRPLAVLPVAPDDFPFRSAVRRHRPGESAWRVVVRLVIRSLLRRPSLA